MNSKSKERHRRLGMEMLDMATESQENQKSSKTSVFRSKYKKMSSQVQDQNDGFYSRLSKPQINLPPLNIAPPVYDMTRGSHNARISQLNQQNDLQQSPLPNMHMDLLMQDKTVTEALNKAPWNMFGEQNNGPQQIMDVNSNFPISNQNSNKIQGITNLINNKNAEVSPLGNMQQQNNGYPNNPNTLNQINHPYSNPIEYLESITTTVDCKKDLGLYEIDRSISTEKMSLVGIKILSHSLQQAYGNKKYIIRCYQSQKKIMEMPLDCYKSVFAFILKGQAQQVYVMDLSAQLLADTSKPSTSNQNLASYVTDPIILKHSLFDINQDIVSFKIGIFRDGSYKIVFITHKQLYIMPFSTRQEDIQNKPHQFEQHTVMVQSTSFNYNQTKTKTDDDEDEDDDDDENEDEDDQIQQDENEDEIVQNKSQIEQEEIKNEESGGDRATALSIQQSIKREILKNNNKLKKLTMQTSIIVPEQMNHLDLEDFEDDTYQPFSPKNVEISRLLDFGVNYQFQLGFNYDRKPNEILLMQDSQKRILVMQGKSWGTKYNLIDLIEISDQLKKNVRLVFEIIDAVIISTNKIIFLIKIYRYVNPNDINNPPSKKEIKKMQYDKRVLYKFQMWELQQEKKRKPIAFDIHEYFINELQLNWRSGIALDIKNNEFYIQDFKSSDLQTDPQVYKMMINNNLLGQVDSYQMSIDHIRDFIGHNLSIKEAKEKHNLSGLLYQDFLVFESLLYLTHGRFITILDINNPKDTLCIQHLCLGQQTVEEKKQKKVFGSLPSLTIQNQNPFNMKNEIRAIMMLDKDNMQEYSSRWIILAIFNDGSVYEVQENHKPHYNSQSSLIPQKQSSGKANHPSLPVQGLPVNEQFVAKKRTFNLDQQYLLNDMMQHTKIPGKILQIYRDKTSSATLPFFFLEVESAQSNSKEIKYDYYICTIEPRKQLLKQYKLEDLNEQSKFFILNTQSHNYEDLLVIEGKDQDQQLQEIEQSFKHYRLLNKSKFILSSINRIEIESKKDLKFKILKNDELPKETISMNNMINHFSIGTKIYFVFPKTIQSYDYVSNQFDEIQLNDNIQQLQILKDNYFYWRQFDRSEFYIPLTNHLYFDVIEDLPEMRSRSQKKEYKLFNSQTGSHIFPHLQQIYNDRVGQQLAAFVDYNSIKIFPYLHQNKIKIKNSGLRSTSDLNVHILASQMFGDHIYSLHSDCTLEQWSLHTAKLTGRRTEVNLTSGLNKDNQSINLDLAGYKLQQVIKQKFFLLRREYDPYKAKDQSNKKNIKTKFKGSKQESYESKKSDKKTSAYQSSILPPINEKKNKELRIQSENDEDLAEEEIQESQGVSQSDQSDDNDDYDIYEGIMPGENLRIQNDDVRNRNNVNQSEVKTKLRSFTQRQKNRKKQKQKEQGFNDFGIETQNVGVLKMAEYLIIQILENSSNDQDDSDRINRQDQPSNNHADLLSKIKIKVIKKFLGPYLETSNNFGLYSSEDIGIIAFYFKDIYKNLQIYYYELVSTPSSDEYGEENLLKLLCRQNQNVLLSVHSMDFKYFLKYNLNEELEVTPFDANTQQFQQTEEQKKDLFEINSKLRVLYNASMKEREPSFLSKNEILFMSSDDILLCYKIFEDQRGAQNQSSEQFVIAQCPFPGSTNSIPMDTFFMIDENRLIGQNSLLYEQLPHPRNKQRNIERVAPNYFNEFFFQPACSEHDMDDANEMKYIQIHFKQKIEVTKQMYQGYIFTSRDFIDARSYQTEMFVVNTFNFYQWRALKLIKQQRLIISDISKTQLQNLSFAQLPNGKTLMHMIKRNQESISALYSIVYDKNYDVVPFYVPILEDYRGQNVLMTLFHKKFKSFNLEEASNQKGNASKWLPQFNTLPDEEKQAKIQQFNDLQNVRDQVAIEILKRIGEYPYDLFKVKMSQIIYKLMCIDIVSFAHYMDSRTKMPSIITQVQIAKVNQDYVTIMTSDSLWCVDPKELRQAVENPIYDVRKIEMKVFDVPHIHLSKNLKKNRYNINLIYEKLADTDNVTVFSCNSVKALIELKWNYIKVRIFWWMLVPYILLLIFFVFYTCYDLMIFDTYTNDGTQTASIALRSIVLILASYFAVMEVRQLILTGWRYFLNGWNYMDISIVSLIYAAEIMQGNTIDMNVTESEIAYHQNLEQSIRTIESVVAILLWLRLLYFFRIFRTTGYYIRMLVEVIKDIRYFIFIFALTIIAFGHAYFIILKNDSSNLGMQTISLALGNSYRLALGDFTIISLFGDYHVEISWVYFVISSLILQIVLINLLISIVSDTFQRIKSNYNVIMYKDMLHMIIENRFLAIGALEKSLQKKYLFVGVPISEDDDQSQEMARRLEDIEFILREQLRKQTDIQKKTASIVKVEERESQIIERLDKMEERQKQILTLLEAKLNK